MVCYNPIPAVYSIKEYKTTGKKNIQLVVHQDTEEKRKMTRLQYPPNLYELIHIPCGKCVGCRSDNAKMWSLRAYNELQLHDKNCFITLTYNDDNPLVQADPLCLGDLRYKHFQNFMKRLRKKTGEKIQYLVCGEYGLKDGRSHWHAILFGYDFPDKVPVYVSKGFTHFSSQLLNECWSIFIDNDFGYYPIGFTDLTTVDIDCCNYVAGYVLKKLPVGEHGLELYEDKYGDIVELGERTPPMVRSSRNPALGLNWYKKFGKNACEKGFEYLVNKNKSGAKRIKTPSYYFKKFELDEPELFTKLKEKRAAKAKEIMLRNPPDYKELKRQEESHLYRITKTIKEKLVQFVK